MGNKESPNATSTKKTAKRFLIQHKYCSLCVFFKYIGSLPWQEKYCPLMWLLWFASTRNTTLHCFNFLQFRKNHNINVLSFKSKANLGKKTYYPNTVAYLEKNNTSYPKTKLLFNLLVPSSEEATYNRDLQAHHFHIHRNVHIITCAFINPRPAERIFKWGG